MDQATLVRPDIGAGWEAIEALEAAGIRPLVATFVFLPEYEDWRLVLSSSALDQVHSLEAYRQVTKALGGRFVYTLPLILVLPINDSFVRDLCLIFAARLKVGKKTVVRLGGQTIGERWIEDAYVLVVPEAMD